MVWNMSINNNNQKKGVIYKVIVCGLCCNNGTNFKIYLLYMMILWTIASVIVIRYVSLHLTAVFVV